MKYSLEDFKKIINERAFVSKKNARITQLRADGNSKEMEWLYDFRSIVLDPEWLNTYAELFWEQFSAQYPFQVGGLETAGIPLVTAIVMKGVERGTPVNGFFMRKSRKREGLMKAIEGTLNSEKIILVDDLINTGGTFKKQIAILQDIGLTVTDIFPILAFRNPSSYSFGEKYPVRVNSLFTLEDFGMPFAPNTTTALTADAFKEVWKFEAKTPSLEYVIQKSAPIVDENHVYFGTDSGTLYALDLATGDRVWTFDVGPHPFGKGIFSSPALHDGTIFFGAYDGNVYALDAKTGEELWRNSDADWVGSSPALAPSLGLVYVGLEHGLIRKRGGISAIDIHTGTTLWRDRTPFLTHCSPLYIPEENLVVIGDNGGTVYAYDAKDGTRRFAFQTEKDIKTRATFDPKRRIILVPSMDAKVYALTLDGEPKFAFEAGAAIYSIPLVHDDTCYIASLDKRLYAFDLETGKKKAHFETSGRIFASPKIYEGSMWIGSNDGRLYELDIETLSLKNSFQATERIVNAIAYDAKRTHFLVPTVANEMYCLKRK